LRRFTRLPRRILAISAATFIGAVGAVALGAAPASAHHVILTGDTVCGDAAGTAVITWTVSNSKTDKVGTIKDVTRKVTGLENGTKVEAQKSVVATETVKLAEGSVSFGLRMVWKDFEETIDPPVVVDLSKLKCGPVEQPKKPTYKGVSNCDGTMTVTIENTSDAPRKFAVNGSGEFVQRKDLAVGEKWVVEVPADNAAKVAVKYKEAKDNDWENNGDARIEWVKPDTCYKATSKSTCTGLTVTVENTGAKAITAKITVGDKSDEMTIEPGKSDTTDEIEGVDGLVATLTINNDKAQEFKWEKPTDCGGGGLPVTGVNAGLLAGAALVLVSGGGGLFFMARRRRVRLKNL
jgi:hypothetical protein